MKPLFALFLILLSTGCNTLYQTRTSGPTTMVTFSSMLPDGLDELMDTCHDPLTLNGTSFDPKGTCVDGTQMTSLAGQGAWAAVYNLPAVDLSGTIPSDVTSNLNRTITFNDIFPRPGPLENCFVTVKISMTLLGAQFENADSQWLTTTDSSKAAFHLDLDSTSAATPFAQGTITSACTCPSIFNKRFADSLTLILPNGPHTIFLDDADFDVWLSFASAGNDVTVTTETGFDFAQLRISPEFNPLIVAFVGSFETMFESSGTTIDELKTQINTAISAALATNVAPKLATLLESAVPAGNKICSLGTKNGKLFMSTRRDGLLCPTPSVIGSL